MMVWADRFGVGETVKVKSYLGYGHEDRTVHLTADFIEVISSVKVVVK